MAHSGDGTGWSETTPADTEFVKDGAKEVRDLRKGARIRLAKEHDTPAASSVGGEHKAGSAKAYYQSSAPTTRPDGSTALTAADNGRLFVDSDDNAVYVYIHGTGFVQLAADVLAGSVETADLDDGAVTTAKLADESVDSDKYVDGSIDPEHLADEAVETAKIADEAVTLAKMAAAAIASLGLASTKIAVYQDQKSSGTDGQSLTAGDWRTREITAEVSDAGSLGALSSNQVTLSEGTYLVFAVCPTYNIAGSVQSRLYNVTDASVLVLGNTSNGGGSLESISHVLGVFSVGASKALALQTQIPTASSASTGVAASFGTEVYTTVVFIKLS